jgi:hypothetical protein
LGYCCLVSTDDAGGTTANDLGGAEDMLSPMQATDSDDIRNDDGDEVVNPPEDWSGVDKVGMTAREQREGETLDERLAGEEPDVVSVGVDPAVADDPATVVAAYPGTDVAPEEGGRHRGQVGGTPEDGDGLFPLVD